MQTNKQNTKINSRLENNLFAQVLCNIVHDNHYYCSHNADNVRLFQTQKQSKCNVNAMDILSLLFFLMNYTERFQSIDQL